MLTNIEFYDRGEQCLQSEWVRVHGYSEQEHDRQAMLELGRRARLLRRWFEHVPRRQPRGRQELLQECARLGLGPLLYDRRWWRGAVWYSFFGWYVQCLWSPLLGVQSMRRSRVHYRRISEDSILGPLGRCFCWGGMNVCCMCTTVILLFFLFCDSQSATQDSNANQLGGAYPSMPNVMERTIVRMKVTNLHHAVSMNLCAV